MQVFLDNFWYMLKGAWITAALALIGVLAGSAIGVLSGLLALLGPAPVRRLIAVWVYCMRGVPVLVVMFIVYFGLPAAGLRLNSFSAVAISLSVYVGAFYSEIFRGSIAALPRGQREAGMAIGLSRFGVVRNILLPQAVPVMTAPWLNISVIAVKSSAYAAIVGVWELTLASREVVERTLQPFPIFFGAMLIYFVICFPLSLLARRAGRTAGLERIA